MNEGSCYQCPPPYLSEYHCPGDAQVSEYITVREVTFPHPLWWPLICDFSLPCVHPEKVSACSFILTMDFPCNDVLDHWTHYLFYLAHVRVSHKKDIQELINIHWHKKIWNLQFRAIHFQDISMCKLFKFWMKKQSFHTPGNYYLKNNV